jgi:hypothetical protein
MATPLPDRIADLKARKEKLAAQINALAIKAKNENRKRDTRRKIVVGAAMLAAMEHEPALAPEVRRVLARFVSRDQDRSVVADLLDPSPALENSAQS